MTRYLDLAEYLWLAEQVTGVEASVLAKASRMELADSALHAPCTSRQLRRRGVLSRLVRQGRRSHVQAGLDHPLPDGNKRAAWASLVMFLELNGGAWDPDPPDVDQAEEAMIAVAAHQRDEAWLAGWLRHRVRLVGAGRALTDVATPSSDAVADKVSAS